MTSETRTEAGRTLLKEHTSGSPHMTRHVAAIESEARSLALSEVEAAVTGLQANPRLDLDGEADHGEMRALDDVLAAISALREGTKA